MTRNCCVDAPHGIVSMETGRRFPPPITLLSWDPWFWILDQTTSIFAEQFSSRLPLLVYKYNNGWRSALPICAAFTVQSMGPIQWLQSQGCLASQPCTKTSTTKARRSFDKFQQASRQLFTRSFWPNRCQTNAPKHQKKSDYRKTNSIGFPMLATHWLSRGSCCSYLYQEH